MNTIWINVVKKKLYIVTRRESSLPLDSWKRKKSMTLLTRPQVNAVPICNTIACIAFIILQVQGPPHPPLPVGGSQKLGGFEGDDSYLNNY